MGCVPILDILLSTYNGGAYLGELLDSILAQTHRDWRLIVRDDGSSDDTVEIINWFSARHPERVTMLENGGRRLGACRSFARLLEASAADYVMFCDQDDVWLPDKIEVTLGEMRRLESTHSGEPILVHTDMRVVDSGLNTLSDSFWGYQRLDPGLRGLNDILVLNNVTGCTAMVNRGLREMSLPVPDGAILHDWWVALVASAFGRIGYIDRPTILYRQHGKNEAGAARYSLGYFSARVRNIGASMELARRIVEQARSFHLMYGGRLSEADREVAYNFHTIFQQWRIKRLFTLLRFRLRAHGFLRNLGISTLFLLLGDKGR